MVLSHFANERHSPYFRASSNAVSDFTGRIGMALGHLASYDLVCIPASANYYVRTLADESIANFDRRKEMQAHLLVTQQQQQQQSSFESDLHQPRPTYKSSNNNFYSLAFAASESSIPIGSYNGSDIGLTSFHNTSFGSTTGSSDNNYSPPSLSKVPSMDGYESPLLSYFNHHQPSNNGVIKDNNKNSSSEFASFEPPPGLGFATTQLSLFDTTSSSSSSSSSSSAGFSPRELQTPISEYEQRIGFGGGGGGGSNHHQYHSTSENGNKSSNFSIFHSSSSSMF
jgi:hypothetical protein